MALELRQTGDFAAWLASLQDAKAKSTIAKRLVRVASGLMGDVKPVGEGISELRIDVGPGYRLYLKQQGKTLIVLLCGGDKRTQSRDIKRAKSMARELE